MEVFNKKLILASKSPRRSELLTKAGFDFELKAKDVNEDFGSDMDVFKVPEHLAERKAEACKSFLSEGQILLAADTVVIFKGEIFGKPRDLDHAKAMLSSISGQKHTVVSGVCLLSLSKKVCFSDTSDVYIAPLTEEEISYYVDRYKPLDKAGSYAIQEWIGLCKIDRIEGSYSNIMGLPMQKVYPALARF